jgi:hypothetical protein
MRHSLFAAAACVTAAAALAAQQPTDRQTFRRGREILTIDASVRTGPSLAIVEVTYREDPAMPMLVPATMRKRYSITYGGITAEASYWDDRRFQSSVRST